MADVWLGDPADPAGADAGDLRRTYVLVVLATLVTFAAGAVVSGAGLLATLFLPPVQFSHGVPAAAGEQLIEAEMANLNPDDEPVAINE